MKIGQKVKVKNLFQLRKLTNIGFQKQVTLKSGLIFSPIMLVYADQVGEITKVAHPGDDGNKLTKEAYKIGEVDIYWSSELLEVVE